MIKRDGTFIIAEVGSVHDGSLGNAIKLAELAQSCGADAVKFQTHIAEAETVKSAPQPHYFKGEPRYAYFQRTGFSLRQWKTIKQCCDDIGVEFMSSPFSIAAVDILEEVGVDKYKIPSGEVTNLPLIEYVSRQGKTTLLSSGMSDWKELDLAVDAIRGINNEPGDLVVMQCSSEYPCQYENVGLNVIAEMKQRYSCLVGLSDHTTTNYAIFAAVALGACAVEKHLTFSRRMYGSDAVNSAEPEQFLDLVQGIRAIDRIVKSPVNKDAVSIYAEMKRVFEKSLVARVAINKGDFITVDKLDAKKPGDGISPSEIAKVVGLKARRDIGEDAAIRFEDLDSSKNEQN